MGQLIKEPLTLANFGDGRLAEEVNSKLADVMERFRSEDDGECALASEKASITVTLHVSRSSRALGFDCGFDEPKVKLPAKKRHTTPAIVESGVLYVDAEVSTPSQVPLRSVNAKE